MQATGFVVGALLILVHAFGFLQPIASHRALVKFPRSPILGPGLLSVAAIWTFVLIKHMDLGEFAPFRQMMLIATLIAWGLSWKFVPEFLAVRSLGMILLLAADPLLGAAFLQPETSRLLLVVLAYAWIIFGLFLVGMPYLFRDLVVWAGESSKRWRAMAAAGVVYGLLILGFAFTW
jgi:hypothetical protein